MPSTNTHKSTTSTKRAGIAATLLAAAALFGGLGSAAVASAEARTLDIDKLAECERAVDVRAVTNGWGWSQHLRELRKCCLQAGGEFTSEQHCIAQDEERSPDTGPTTTKPGVPRVETAGSPTKSSP